MYIQPARYPNLLRARAVFGKRLWADGTNHLVFELMDLLARLAALPPRPRVNLGSGSCRYGRIATTVPSATSASKAPQWEECGTNALWILLHGEIRHL